MAIVWKWSLNWNANDWIWINNWTATNVSYIDWKSNLAGSFNWINSYVNIPNSTSLNINWSWSSVSIEVYVKINWFPWFIIRKWFEWANASNYWIYILNTNYLFFRVVATNWRSHRANFILSTNIWYYIVATCSYWDTTPTIYINWNSIWLTIEDSAISTYLFPSNTNPVRLGSSSDNTGYFNWIIDEAIISNHILTPAEIKNKYLFYNWFI